ncbi:unnamed protein product [Tilletia laevis]|uniref:Uncharacterized protein n=1 Tax=Tilletia laevis TaxID=157183 RepID=A0A9N8LWL0_9BASI|nr:unnamed protein product [Tilletia laevis]
MAQAQADACARMGLSASRLRPFRPSTNHVPFFLTTTGHSLSHTAHILNSLTPSQHTITAHDPHSSRHNQPAPLFAFLRNLTPPTHLDTGACARAWWMTRKGSSSSYHPHSDAVSTTLKQRSISTTPLRRYLSAFLGLNHLTVYGGRLKTSDPGGNWREEVA